MYILIKKISNISCIELQEDCPNDYKYVITLYIKNIDVNYLTMNFLGIDIERHKISFDDIYRFKYDTSTNIENLSDQLLYYIFINYSLTVEKNICYRNSIHFF